MLGGYLIFESDPGFVSLCGAVAALGGMSVYTSLNLTEPKDIATKALSTQNLVSSRPKASTEDDEEPNTKSAINVV